MGYGNHSCINYTRKIDSTYSTHRSWNHKFCTLFNKKLYLVFKVHKVFAYVAIWPYHCSFLIIILVKVGLFTFILTLIKIIIKSTILLGQIAVTKIMYTMCNRFRLLVSCSLSIDKSEMVALPLLWLKLNGKL